MKQRDLQLLMVAKFAQFIVHTPFGSVPAELKRDDSGAVDLRFLFTIKLTSDGKGHKRGGLSKDERRAVKSAYKTLMDVGVAPY